MRRPGSRFEVPDFKTPVGRRSLKPGTWILQLSRLLGLLALCLCLTPARAETSREYRLKAVFLYNFIQFTDWPTNAFESTDSPLVVGVLGTDPFGPFLDQTVRGEISHGHPIVVQRFRTVEEIKTCHILFI